MGRAYRVDLRLRVLAAVDGGMSKMQASRTFQLSRSTLDDWLRLRAQTGSVQVQTPQHPVRGLGAHEGFKAFVERHPHSTLAQMQQAWQREMQQAVSTMSFSHALRQHGSTRKKRVIATGSDARPSGRPLLNK